MGAGVTTLKGSDVERVRKALCIDQRLGVSKLLKMENKVSEVPKF